MFGLVKKLISLGVLLVVAYAGYRWGPAFFPAVERALGRAPAEALEAEAAPAGPSAEVAEATLDRFEAFRSGDGDRLALGGGELTSVVRYALPGIIPPGVSEPTVGLSEGRIHLSARVAVDAFPRLPKLDEIVGLLPDTVLIEMDGTLVALDQSFLALMVDRVHAARIPIPSRMVPEVLKGLGRGGTATLPKDALAVPIPDGIGAVFIQRDSLVLVAKR